MQITPATVDDVEQLYIARVLLESEAVRETVPRLGSRDDAELAGYLAQMDHYGRRQRLGRFAGTAQGVSFPALRRGGDRLVGLITELAEHAERYRVANAASPELWGRRQHEHRAIASAASRA